MTKVTYDEKVLDKILYLWWATSSAYCCSSNLGYRVRQLTLVTFRVVVRLQGMKYFDGRYMNSAGPRWMRARFTPGAPGLKALGKELKLLRLDFGYSREELASMLGCSGKTVQNWELARQGISKRDLRQLDNLLDTSFVQKYGAIVG